MNYRSVFLFLLVIFLSHAAYSQELNFDVVYLKNGSVLKGVITEELKGEYIKLRTEGGVTMELLYSDIKKINKEAIPNLQPELSIKRGENSTYRKGEMEEAPLMGVGIGIGGGTLINLPVRFYLKSKMALEFGLGVSMINYGVVETQSNGSEEANHDRFRFPANISGGLEFTLSEYKDGYKLGYVRKGLFTKLALTPGTEFYGEKKISLGYFREGFPRKHPASSYGIKIGATVLVYEQTVYKHLQSASNNTFFAVFLSWQWNYLVR